MDYLLIVLLWGLALVFLKRAMRQRFNIIIIFIPSGSLSPVYVQLA